MTEDMAHLTAIIDQITRMENSLVNILLETAVKLSTLTDANIFVMVESAGGRKWAGRKSLRDEYVRGMLQPSSKDVEVTETVSSMPHEEFSMGNLMGMASSATPDPPPPPAPVFSAVGPAVFPTAQQQQRVDILEHQQQQQPSAAKRPRISTEPSNNMIMPSLNIPSSKATASNNNITSSPPHHRRKSPSRDQISQTVILDGGLSPKPPSLNNRPSETISKNLKDEFNGEQHPPDIPVVIKEELGGGRTSVTNLRGGIGVLGVEERFEDDDADASVDDGGAPWGEVALAGPSGLQQNSDANQPEPERIGIADYMAARTPEPYVCNFCYVVFENATLLADHQTSHEAPPIDSASAIGPTLPPSLLSNDADAYDDDDDDENGDDGITIEGYAHPNGKDYLCTICNKPFKRKDYFKQHLLSHSRKFQCPHCAFNFARKDHLGRHLKNRICLRGLENDQIETKSKMMDGARDKVDDGEGEEYDDVEEEDEDVLLEDEEEEEPLEEEKTEVGSKETRKENSAGFGTAKTFPTTTLREMRSSTTSTSEIRSSTTSSTSSRKSKRSFSYVD